MPENTKLSKVASLFDVGKFKELKEKMTYEAYLEKLYANPKLVRNSFQYVYDMIMSKGTSKFTKYRKTYTNYNFFECADIPETPIFGLMDSTIHEFMQFLKGAAGGM
jgi:serine protein kinase